MQSIRWTQVERCVLVGLFVALAGCAEGAAGPVPDGGGLDSGNADLDASTPDASDADTQADASSFAILGECELPDPCAGQASTGQLVENTTVNATGTCVLEAMRDRVAGTYLHVSNHTFSNGSRNIEHRFIVHADATVTHATRDALNYSVGPDSFEEITAPPAQRCQLQPADYFAACRAAVTAVSANTQTLRDCMYLEPTDSPITWFTSCSDTDNRCE